MGLSKNKGVPYFGVLIIRILLLRVLHEGPLFSETPIWHGNKVEGAGSSIWFSSWHMHASAALQRARPWYPGTCGNLLRAHERRPTLVIVVLLVLVLVLVPDGSGSSGRRSNSSSSWSRTRSRSTTSSSRRRSSSSGSGLRLAERHESTRYS